MKIKITADSTADLSEELKQKYNIDIVPLKVLLGEDEFTDGVDITPQKIFDYVAKTGILPKTAAPNIEVYEKTFEKYLKNYDAVIHINISSKASSSHSNAKKAAEKFNGKAFAVDSQALSTGQGLIAIKASELAGEGKSPEEIVETLNEVKTHTNTSFVPDRLDYLHKGGRCSLAALLGAKVLKLHPMIDMKDGQMYAKKKYMGNMERCLKNYVKDLSETYRSYDKSKCIITHSSCEKDVVDMVRKEVQAYFDFEEIYETVAGSVVTGHCGKNTLGVLFIYNK